MSGEWKPRWARAVGIQVAKELVAVLQPACQRLVVAGSLRRLKPDVGDVELVFIAKQVPAPGQTDLFGPPATVSAADLVLGRLLEQGRLRRRLKVDGKLSAWGPANKFAHHTGTGMPVDFFAATEQNWWHYLVCRTGPAELNTRIATRALEKGWKWHPYSVGFTDAHGKVVPCCSEEAVFFAVGLPYRKPAERR